MIGYTQFHSQQSSRRAQFQSLLIGEAPVPRVAAIVRDLRLIGCVVVSDTLVIAKLTDGWISVFQHHFSLDRVFE